MVDTVVDAVVGGDIYGHPIGVNYEGSDTYQTKLGAFFTMAVYVLVIFNFIAISVAFKEGTWQDE